MARGLGAEIEVLNLVTGMQEIFSQIQASFVVIIQAASRLGVLGRGPPRAGKPGGAGVEV